MKKYEIFLFYDSASIGKSLVPLFKTQ